MRIEVGYGMEGRIPDAKAQELLALGIPHLKAQDYDRAVQDIVLATLRIAQSPQTQAEQWFSTATLAKTAPA